MRIGDLRVPFTLQSQDKNGEWSNVKSLWGSLDIYEGADYSHQSIIRYGEADISTGMRLNYDARYFLISAVEKGDEQNIFLRLFLQEDKKLG